MFFRTESVTTSSNCLSILCTSPWSKDLALWEWKISGNAGSAGSAITLNALQVQKLYLGNEFKLGLPFFI